MIIIAKKSILSGLFSIIAFVLFLVLTVLFMFQKTLIFLIPSVFLLISLVNIVNYFTTPKNVIKINEQNQIVINHHVKILFSDIISIKYKQARARHFTYRYGKVIIKTKTKTFKVRFVDDCALASIKLNEFFSTIKKRLLNIVSFLFI